MEEAQAPNAPAARFSSKATSLQCDLQHCWRPARGRTGPRKHLRSRSSSPLGFTSIDTQEGTADAIGDARKSHITVRVVGNYLNLMQMNPIQRTRRHDGVQRGIEERKAAGRAHSARVSSRPKVRGLTSRPERSYGDCAV